MKNSSSSINIGLLGKGILLTFLILGVIAFILAVISYTSSWHYSGLLIKIGIYLSVIIGAAYACSKLKQKLWMHGMLIGMAFLVIVTLFRADFSLFLSWAWLKQLFAVSASGLLGGLIGGILQQ
ncbi:MAG: TIGR04086 family membrane protein [Firmicutes bacterium]|nr:TIGR04086 family membrane protein [Bacillota bacterium]